METRGFGEGMAGGIEYDSACVEEEVKCRTGRTSGSGWSSRFTSNNHSGRRTSRTTPAMMILHMTWPYVCILAFTVLFFSTRTLYETHKDSEIVHVSSALQQWRHDAKNRYDDFMCNDTGEVLAMPDLARECVLLKTRYAHKGRTRNIHVAINVIHGTEDCMRSGFVKNSVARLDACTEEHRVARAALLAHRGYMGTLVTLCREYAESVFFVAACVTLAGSLYSTLLFVRYMYVRASKTIGGSTCIPPTIEMDTKYISGAFSFASSAHKQE